MSSPVNELLIVDPAVENADLLLAGLNREMPVLRLSGNAPLSEISCALSDISGLERLHVLSHGAPGALSLAGENFSLDALLRHPDLLSALDSALESDGEILFYGCSVAGGSDGYRFTSGLGDALDRCIVASPAPVGRMEDGGSWAAFEHNALAFNAASRAAFPGRLASGTVDFTGVSPGPTVTQMVDGVTVTVVNSAGRNINVLTHQIFTDAGGIGVIAGVDEVEGIALTSDQTLTVSFSAPVSITSFRFLELVNRSAGNYVFTPDNGTAGSVSANATELDHGNTTDGITVNNSSVSDWGNVNNFTISYSGGTSWQPGIDTIVFGNASANALPALGGTPAPVTINEASTNQAINLSAYEISDTDDDTITLTLAVSSGKIAATDGNGTTTGATPDVTIASSGTGSMTLQGTAANLNTYLNDASKIVFTPISSSTSAVTLTVTPYDGTADGTAGTVTINITDVTAASTNAAGFNTTSGTNLDTGITFGSGDETLTIASASHTTGSTANGGAGADSIVIADSGTDLTNLASLSGFQTLSLNADVTVTMSETQLDQFTTAINGNTGTEQITLSSSNGDDAVTGDADIEIYNLNDVFTFTLGSAGQSVIGNAGSNQTVQSTASIDTLNGTLNGGTGGSDTLVLDTGDNIADATISNFENLTLGDGSSVTMTVTQLNGFTGTISADGTNTITLTSTGTLSNTNLAAIETLATASGGSETITLAASAASGKTLTATDTGADHFVVTGSAGAQGITGSAGGDTIDGGAGADTIGGGAGTDRLTGGDDSDRFIGSVSDLNGDTITDLASGETILLTGVTGLSTAYVRFNGSSVQIDTDATDFGSPEVTITTSTDLSSSLTISSVADFGGNTLITLGTASVSATTNAAGFNTTDGTNLTPALTFAGTDDTLTVADASHITSTSVANGGDGTDTIVLADGSDLTTTDFTFTSFETATLSADATVTMSESQHDAFGTINGNSGTEAITLNAANGDGNVTGDADIETYNLNGAFTFTLGTAGQSVIGNAGANQTVQSSASIDTLTGTLNGGTGGSDTLVLDTGDNIAGATVSNFENLTLGDDSSVSMTAAQLGGFTGTVVAAGTETITLTATGNASGADISTIETIATAGGSSAQTVTLTATQAAGKTLTAADTGLDHFIITGSAGSQTIAGSAGADTIDGGAGADTLSGASGADVITGGDGADLLIGGAGADTLSGSAGNDTLSGGDGFDELLGGDGNDSFVGTDANFNGDTISGLAAGDVITISDKDLKTALNGTTLGSTIDLGGGQTLNLSGAASNLTISASLNGDDTVLTFATPAPPSSGSSGGGSSGPLVVTDGSTDTSTGGARTITNNGSTSGSAAIVQNTGNNGNIVTATLPANTSITSEGPATAQSSTDALNTLITAIDNRDSTAETDLIGGARAFLTKLSSTTRLDVRTIIPTTTNSSLGSPIIITGTDGGTQSEAFVIDLRSLPSGSTLQLDNIEFASIMGNATVNGGAGENYVTGDDASQFISLGAEDDTLYGGGGADTIGSGGGEDILYGNQGDDFVFGGDGMDTLYGGQDADIVHGDNGNDVVYGNKGDDTLSGGENDDVLFGGQNDDIVYGNTGNDTLNGNRGNDTLYGGENDDIVYGNQGDDTLDGNSGNDTLYGGQNNDLISGGGGDDHLAGNLGNDTLVGGDGADTFSIQTDNGMDVISDFNGAEGDRLSFTDNNAGGIDTFAELQAATTADGSNSVIALGNGNTVTLIGVNASELQSGWFSFS